MDIVSYGSGGHVLAVDENGHLIGGLQGSGSDCEFEGETNLSTGEWFFVTMTRDLTNNIKLYVDGVLEDSATCLYTPYYYYSEINIGRNPGWSEYFNGVIDEVRIWNKVLEQSEIQSNMHKELTGDENGLIGYWPFNEGTGNIAFDKTSNNNDGTLYDGATWVNSTAPVWNWLTTNPSSGTIAPDSTVNIVVTFNAAGLKGGDYYANIIISYNDSKESEISIPVHLNVTDAPSISIESDTIDFSQVYLGVTLSLELVVSNNGSHDLLISSAITEPSEYSVSPAFAGINAGAEEIFTIDFSPQEVAHYPGILTFFTNDPNDDTLQVILTGYGIEPPDISIDPDSLCENLLSGKNTTRTLTINNSGKNDLDWEINLENIGLGTLTFTKDNYADWTDPANQDCITENVCITRADIQGIFNAVTENSYNYQSPDDTEWSFGYTENLQPKDYQIWRDAVNGYPPGMVGQPMSLHLISDDKYFDIMFHSWTIGGNGGGFSYTRTDIAPRWLEVSQESGAVPPDSSIDIKINFDASGLEGGNYDANIVISSNDPDEPEVTIPVIMHITDATSISVEFDTIDFKQVFLNDTMSLGIKIENNGSQDLLIFNAKAEPSEYSVSPGFAAIDAGDTETFTVSFLPQVVEDYPGMLIFTSNDPVNDTLKVVLAGQGIEPPVISISADSLSEVLLRGTTSTQTLKISNLGSSGNLYFDVSIPMGGHNYAIQLDGLDDYIGLSKPLSDMTELTIQAWVHYMGGNNVGTIFMDATCDNGNDFILDMKSNGIGILADKSGAILSYEDAIAITGLNLGNAWHHVTWTMTSSESKIYIDGDLKTTKIESGSNIGYHATNPSIGRWWDECSDFKYFNGLIDELRIWDTALEQFEIQSNMHIELTSAENGLIGYWPFNESMGNIAFDKTSNNNDGTLHGGAMWVNSTAPVLSWLSAIPDSGVCLPGSSINVQITYDATILNIGDYYTTISISSNDPDLPEIIIPVYLNVNDTATYLNNIKSRSIIKLYPNPTESIIYLEIQHSGNESYEVEIINISGKVIYQKSGLIEQINLSGFPKGIYFIKVKVDKYVMVEKIVIQ